jgi:hypothetical protein
LKRNIKDYLIFCYNINVFNEAWWEAILFPSVYLFSLIGLYFSYKKFKEATVED